MSTKKTTAYYMRTSHYLQNIITQVDKIPEGAKVFKDEGVSGRISFIDRPAGKKLLEAIREGKITEVMVMRIDRLGRDTGDILATIKLIHQYKVPITSLNEGITTLVDGKATPMTGLMINLLSSIAEFQYHQNREKTLAGIAKARALGKYKGRKPGSVEDIAQLLSKPKVQNIIELLKDNVGIRKICRVTESSPNYVYKIKNIQLARA
jgi:DNA invertase Pin-like site-specific DNA recombinase